MLRHHSRLVRGFIAGLAGAWIVVALITSPARAAEPDRVTLRVEAVSDGTFRVTAEVFDAQGAPVEEVPVNIKMRTTFGWLLVAKGLTDAGGRVRASLSAPVVSREVAAEAGEEGQVRAAVRFGRGTFREPSVRPAADVLSGLSPQPGLVSPYPVPLQVAMLAVILGGIWTTYGYVTWLLSRIRGAG